MSAHALIVVDLGFGDAGKGTVVDALAQRHRARLVVRFNGGAQAGHNVVTDDGRHHTFAQLGAASFDPDARTHLAAPFVLHPGALLVEAEVLREKGVRDPLRRVTISPRALLITPFHQALNQLRERARGPARHGTCGVGVGEAVSFALREPALALRASALATDSLVERAEAARVALRDEAERIAAQGDPAIECLRDEALSARWAASLRGLGACLREDHEVIPDALARDPAVIFEGAQGALLDEWHGFHPHTTWSTCTFDNAQALLAQAGFRGEVTRVGVLRSYATRHGEGPFPTEATPASHRFAEPHNHDRGWQGRFRVGALDLVLARYAVAACGGVDALALTHMDRVTPAWPVCLAYPELDGERFVRARGAVVSITPCAVRDLEAQRALGERLRQVRPSIAHTDSLTALVSERLGAPVCCTSWGPRRGDKRF